MSNTADHYTHQIAAQKYQTDTERGRALEAEAAEKAARRAAFLAAPVFGVEVQAAQESAS